MKIGNPELSGQINEYTRGKDCVQGELYTMPYFMRPRLCVKIKGTLYMVDLKTGHQSNTLTNDTSTKYRHLPDAYVILGEPT